MRALSKTSLLKREWLLVFADARARGESADRYSAKHFLTQAPIMSIMPDTSEMQIATTLRQAIPNLDPTRSLQISELERFYEDRVEVTELLKRMEVELQVQNNCKFLLTGHRGAGKSSALTKLEQMLEIGNGLWVVPISILDKLNLSDVDSKDIIFLMALEILEQCKKHNLKLSKAVQLRLETWSNEIEIVKTIGESAQMSAETKAEISTPSLGWLTLPVKALLSVGGRVGKETETREAIRKTIKPAFSELLAIIDDLQQEIFRLTQKQVVCLVDGTDKTTIEIAETLFYKNGADLSAPQVSVVYTFPVALQSSQEFNQITAYFNDTFVLPNFKIQAQQHQSTQAEKDAELEHCKHGIEGLQHIITRRVQANLFNPVALKDICQASGGIPRIALQLAKAACVNAVVRQDTQVNTDDVARAITRERQAFQKMLTYAQLELLQDVRTKKTIDTDPEKGYLQLLHNLSVIEYVNGKVWYDVHPIVHDLL